MTKKRVNTAILTGFILILSSMLFLVNSQENLEADVEVIKVSDPYKMGKPTQITADFQNNGEKDIQPVFSYISSDSTTFNRINPVNGSREIEPGRKDRFIFKTPDNRIPDHDIEYRILANGKSNQKLVSGKIREEKTFFHEIYNPEMLQTEPGPERHWIEKEGEVERQKDNIALNTSEGNSSIFQNIGFTSFRIKLGSAHEQHPIMIIVSTPERKIAFTGQDIRIVPENSRYTDTFRMEKQGGQTYMVNLEDIYKSRNWNEPTRNFYYRGQQPNKIKVTVKALQTEDNLDLYKIRRISPT